jgi:hypothetical protein
MRKPGADLEQQLEKYRHELAEAREHLAEALEQQTATSEVLLTMFDLETSSGAGYQAATAASWKPWARGPCPRKKLIPWVTTSFIR